MKKVILSAIAMAFVMVSCNQKNKQAEKQIPEWWEWINNQQPGKLEQWQWIKITEKSASD